MPTISLSSAGGDLDGDGLSDLVALLDFGTDEEGVTQTRIYVALGATYRGQRIRGLSLPFEAISPRLVVVDLDADGTDEVAILSVETLSLHALK